MLRTVLIVDDHVQWVEILCAILRIHRIDTVCSGTMAGAVELLRRGQVDATILDLTLPDSDASTSLDQIWRLKGLGAGRVVVVTGALVNEDMITAIADAGGDSAMSKDARNFEKRLMIALGETS